MLHSKYCINLIVLLCFNFKSLIFSKDLTNHVYTVDSVVDEIKDETTRRSLQVLPYEFALKEPTDDALKHVTEFSKKTGDFGILSQVDLKLIALTYQLYKENYDEELSKQLSEKIQIESLKSDKTTLVGFFLAKDNNEKSSEKDLSESKSENDEDDNEEDDQVEDEKNDDNYDDDGWVKPSNIEKLKEKLNADEINLKDKQLKVACMTTDYAMQNVLFQLGIPVVSLDGLLIKKIRNYVMECSTCMKITYDLSKQFCPKCGYKTLKRIIEVIDLNGNKKYFGRKTTTKGLNVS